MKQSFFSFTLIILTSLLLSGCGGESNSASESTIQAAVQATLNAQASLTPSVSEMETSSPPPTSTIAPTPTRIIPPTSEGTSEVSEVSDAEETATEEEATSASEVADEEEISAEEEAPTEEASTSDEEEVPSETTSEISSSDDSDSTSPPVSPSQGSDSIGAAISRSGIFNNEGVIIFLSSRDHEPRTKEERRTLSQHRDMELYGMKPDGSQQTRLSDGSRWGSENVRIVPYLVPNQIVVLGKYVFDLSTRQIVDELASKQRINGLSINFTGFGSGDPAFFAVNPIWRPTGEIVFFSGESAGNIYYMEDIQSKPVQLTNSPEGAWGDGFSSWSPDGEWILFDRQWYEETQDGLWIIKPDGSEMRRIVASQNRSNGTRRSAWSPDGSRIAYEGPKNDTQHYYFELWVVDADGKNAKQLTSLPSDSGIWNPAWSPDGKKIVFDIRDNYSGEQDIFIIDADGGEPEQLTSEGFYNMNPLWLPLDADEILAGGDTELVAAPVPTPRPQPTQPKPAKETNCPTPGVNITSPEPGSRFTGRYNYIVGTANIPNFRHWKIEYSTDPNGGWMYLLEKDYPVDDDKLVMIDASTVPNGPYGLRLTVVDQTGNYPEPCEIWFHNAY